LGGVGVMSILNEFLNKKLNTLQLSTSKRLSSLETDVQAINDLNINAEETVTVESYAQVNSLPVNAANGQLSVTLGGSTVANLFGSKGDCENTSYFTTNIGSTMLIENSMLKLTLTGVSGFSAIPVTLDASKYYFISAEVKNGDVSTTCKFGVRKGDDSAYLFASDNLTTNVVRQGLKLQPSDIVNTMKAGLYLQGLAEQYAYIDNIMANEITVDEYNDLTVDELSAKYPYVTDTQSTLSERVTSVGKNIWGGEKFAEDVLEICGGEYANRVTIDNIDCLAVSGGVSYANNPFPTKFALNTQYTFQVSLKQKSADGRGGYLRVTYTDGTFSDTFYTTNTEWTYSSFTSAEGKSIDYLRMTYGSIGSDYATYFDIDSVQVEKGIVATDYEAYKESVAYFNLPSAMDGLKSLPNLTNDEVNVSTGKVTQNISNKCELPTSGWTLYGKLTEVDTIAFKVLNPFTNYETTDDTHNGSLKIGDISFEARDINVLYANDDESFALRDDGFIYVSVLRSRLATENVTGFMNYLISATSTSLTYQLATPIEHDIQVTGSTWAYPSGTVIVEPVLGDIDFYGTGITIEGGEFSSIDRVTKVDLDEGTEIDVTDSCTLNDDGDGFTCTELDAGDLCWYELYYANSTQPKATYTYYDSRYVLKDTVTGTFYKAVQSVASGVLSTTLVEV
jgi:hypothetical protein